MLQYIKEHTKNENRKEKKIPSAENTVERVIEKERICGKFEALPVKSKLDKLCTNQIYQKRI